MAKKGQLEKEKRRRKLVAKYAEVRAELKAKGDYLALAQLPRNASPSRLTNRCLISGRSRAFIRRFGLSRIVFRKKALNGEIPGVRKISW